jgi:predicted anti-sigma-YlaC factor YlaD
MKTKNWTLLCLIAVVFLCASPVLAEFQWTEVEVGNSTNTCFPWAAGSATMASR